MEDKKSFAVNEVQPWIDYMALSDIEEGEREFERGDTFTHQEVMKMVWDKITSYAGKI